MNDKLEVIVIENESYLVKVLPQRGFKVSSFIYKKNNFEAFHQPQHEFKNLKEKYPKGREGHLFINYDTSGCDDCIPTIDPCEVEFASGTLNDHGETWYKEFDIIDKGENYVEGSTNLSSMPIKFTKKVKVSNNGIKIDYSAINKGDKRYGFMWSLHDLTKITEDSYLELPEPFSYINVQNDEIWDFDVRIMKNLEKNKTYKFYYDKKLSKGEASLIYPSDNMKYTVKFSLEKTPYLGVWITTGGYKGETNLAIEPSTSFYDSLKKAVNNGSAIMLNPGEVFSWDIELNLKELS